MNHDPNNLLVWLDLETTGLNPQRCSIIQMGIIITDDDLNEIEAHEWMVRPYDGEDLYWEEGARRMHEATGLIDRTDLHARAHVSGLVDDLLRKHFGNPWETRIKPMLAGNSVHFDRAFLRTWFPQIEEWFFHRHYDASAVMEWSRRTLGMAPRWSRPKGAARPHTALADLRETLADMRLLREDIRRTVFVQPDFGPPTGGVQ